MLMEIMVIFCGTLFLQFGQKNMLKIHFHRSLTIMKIKALKISKCNKKVFHHE